MSRNFHCLTFKLKTVAASSVTLTYCVEPTARAGLYPRTQTRDHSDPFYRTQNFHMWTWWLETYQNRTTENVQLMGHFNTVNQQTARGLFFISIRYWAKGTTRSTYHVSLLLTRRSVRPHVHFAGIQSYDLRTVLGEYRAPCEGLTNNMSEIPSLKQRYKFN